ncbi:NAD(P)-dependent alcohol dehydrogenase [Novosphingobium mangrovi (ex Hu et al. 2023)]|uniref:NAD(P)-dependent alcohol dehydrogenase n=1 Tax=Novosphingobium mangrovi (ex Hu et al. 2023) TaxID=2930094 RepID=A0ABT0AG11_9SPHN|nr:NAD(P)-dependent alcohol dehydrogenase [Novosphingobium mangrovi (ex Hu et al. 2023)]MCJ1962119.1 NAD(P)-dependent alcohol dehydrogenase [Novosphingobium mangrovi (ex Hu et al. 2023)]
MCKICDAAPSGDLLSPKASHDAGRRGFLKGAAGLGAGAATVGLAANASAAAKAVSGNLTAARTLTGYGVPAGGGAVRAIPLERRALGPRDVAIETMYCGVCHSDIHTIRGEWGPVRGTTVPGHEIVGRVVGVGAQVTRFRVGDTAGVGCMVDSCGTCANCTADLEQYCLNGATWTYGSKADVPGGVTQGGWSQGVTVTEHFAIRMPQTGNLAAMAPLLCAGVTTFSPLHHWNIARGMRVGVVGIGGLGHLAVKLAAAEGADVTMFTTSQGKLADAATLGAKEAVLTGDAGAMQAHAGRYDLIISTIPESYAVAPYASLLALDGTLVSVGTPLELQNVMGGSLWGQRRSLASSLIGGIAETQRVIDYCGARRITADIEMIKPDQIEAAIARVKGKDVRYRFVIDLT